MSIALSDGCLGIVVSLRVSAMKTYVASAFNDYYFIFNGVDRLVQRGGELVIV